MFVTKTSFEYHLQNQNSLAKEPRSLINYFCKKITMKVMIT